MKNLLRLIIDAAKNDDMNRVIELAENQQDRFCDNNCVWTDHHPECVYTNDISKERVDKTHKNVHEPEWYHVIDVHGCNRFYHRTEDCPYKVKTPLYTTPQQPSTIALTWIGLTDEQIEAIEHSVYSRTVQKGKPMAVFIKQFAKGVESELKEINNGSR
jgi:hypothetical protein